ncbi:MAG: type III-B CRISPR-associated protein Cas10/Cmr2, partial [Deltaproteobacteria bacterium]
RYYALVAMDGDKFSEWVAGKRAPRMKWIFHPDLVEGEGKDPRIVEGVGSRLRPLGGGSHLALSAVMKNYALHVVRWAVEVQHAGKLIYAGGDDVIAFVPLRDLFSLLRTLRILFQGESFHESAGGIHIEAGKGIATIEEEEGKHPILLAGGKNPRSDQVFQGPTASAGVALIHESHPLPYAMVEALHHAMKGRAKDRLGRDAFALHLHRRSGEPVECGMKWFVPSRDESAGSFDILEELDAFVGWFDRDDISSRLPYDMARRIEIFHCERSEEELAWYLDALREARPWYLDAQKEEFMRLLGRHTAETDEDTRREIRKHAERLVEAVEEAERLVV